MYATFTLSKDELNISFLDNVKNLFETDQLIISVESYDETEYLSRSPRNHKMLMQSINNVENGIGLKEIPIEEIERAIYENDSI